ncbi:MAG TPA: large conductance mechanosensitive channel protein MscL, partial [Clostridia bacterium]|nr:large conductance mechanosensitive channel protein MscL [Clostridia bacterium]
MLKEFKEFAVKGNVMDLAIAVVIGGAFGKIVSSLVDDIIMPIVGAITGGVNFTYLGLVIKEARGDMPAVTLNYGSFMQSTVDFL